MGPIIDLVADIGEGFGPYAMGDDEAILPSLTSANIACGFHAGDPRIMHTTVRSCHKRGVGIGAHPGFNDREGFGRREIKATEEEIRTDVLYQIGALDAFVRSAGATLQHVTPHGRLGNLVVTERQYAQPVLQAIKEFDPTLIIVTQVGVLEQLARAQGIRVARLGFPDRAYQEDGTLMPRSLPDSVLHDPQEIAARAVQMATTGSVKTASGKVIKVPVDSLLLHGDNATSATNAQMVRRALESSGVKLAPLADVLAKGDHA